jgi:serine/threonine-protein kinase RsbT
LVPRTKHGWQLLVVAEDSGPGIEDIEQAMEFGFSTSKGLGAGLPGTKRLVSEFGIESEPGQTEITIKLKKRKVI